MLRAFSTASATVGTFVWWSSLIGGLAIFLAGLYFLPENLKKIAGEKLKLLIDRSTNGPIRGTLFGFLMTATLQSSSATTVIVIALVKAGLMSLPQAVAVIIGANIGTTITAFIIGLKIGFIAPFLLMIGALMMLFMSRQKGRHIGGVFFGFGALFFGLELMGGALKLLTELPSFTNFIATYGTNHFLGFLVGLFGTALVQSSSAFIGMVQTLYASAHLHGSTPFTLLVALPLLYGANIGTTITAVIASIGGSISAKRAAFAHFMFNVIAAIVCFILLLPINWVLTQISSWLNLQPEMEIAVAHIMFNLIGTAIVLPLLKPTVFLLKKIIPGDDAHDAINTDLSSLNRSIKGVAPATLLAILKEKSLTLGDWALQALITVINFINDHTIADHDKTLQYEQSIDQLYERMTDFMHKMRNTVLEEQELEHFTQILRVIKDIERIGDHCENLIEFLDTIELKGETVNEAAKVDILAMLEVARSMIQEALTAYASNDLPRAQKVIASDDNLDEMNTESRNRHVERFRHGVAETNRYTAMVYIDILSNIERLGDHAVNIAETIVDLKENR